MPEKKRPQAGETGGTACPTKHVGRAPWPAADPLVGLLGRTKSRTRGSGADEGVRPTKCCMAYEEHCGGHV